MLSTGALMLMWDFHSLMMFLPSVSSQGRNYASFSDHYYDSVWRPLNFYANHDPPMEGQLWEELSSEDHHVVPEERRQLREVQKRLCSWSGFCGDLKPSHCFML
ncbi:alpha-N-acetylgalactosaminide alpha-2,6-sialyltransferase 2 [Maylandia zebra]|uniref:alpha-N-acetylgalactosaminide alpha-2,6-sialyltransferase 2 n=1 Tax=Maylandia zebra TaxID=106582 RepID=UPI00403C6AE4